MKIIEGDILSVRSGIIVHQVNCRKVAGAGLALQIRNKYRGWYQDYLHHNPTLGDITIFDVSGRKIKMICNFFAQDGYGRGEQQTSYTAFKLCLYRLKEYLSVNKLSAQVYFPEGIGCGLAGGDWKVVSAMIEEVFPDAVIVRYRKSNILR
jgi:O-acetyl-ADP-ribose deacetylase (regulator of RNase III)